MSDYHSYILERTPELGDDEAAFICRIYDRVLKVGRRSYKEWVAANERRDMGEEANAELLDGCVYLAMRAVMQSETRKRRVQEFRDALHERFDVSDDEEPTQEWLVNKTGADCADCGGSQLHERGCAWATKVPA